MKVLVLNHQSTCRKNSIRRRLLFSAGPLCSGLSLLGLPPQVGVAAPAKKPQPKVWRSNTGRGGAIPPARPVLKAGKTRAASKTAAAAQKNVAARRATENEAIAALRLAEAARPLSAYEQKRRAVKATRLDSVVQVQESAVQLAGQTVEFKGEVVGFLSNARGRTVLLKLEDSMAVLGVSPQLEGHYSSALKPGASVRVLVEVPADGSTSTLSLVAATDEPEAEKLFKDSGETPGAGMFLGSEDDGGLIVVPPMTGTMLPPRSSTKTAASTLSPVPPTQLSPLERETLTESQLPFYRDIVRRHNKKLAADKVEEISRALLSAAYANKMDPRFLAAVIAVESDFDIYCLSSSGAMGLGQLMPFNLKEAGITNPWNPTQNILGTARLLRGHLNDYKDRPNGTLLAVAAYNAGPGAVRRAGYKVPNGSQVQRYVWKVYYRYKAFAPDMFK